MFCRTDRPIQTHPHILIHFNRRFNCFVSNQIIETFSLQMHFSQFHFIIQFAPMPPHIRRIAIPHNKNVIARPEWMEENRPLIWRMYFTINSNWPFTKHIRRNQIVFTKQRMNRRRSSLDVHKTGRSVAVHWQFNFQSDARTRGCCAVVLNDVAVEESNKFSSNNEAYTEIHRLPGWENTSGVKNRKSERNAEKLLGGLNAVQNSLVNRTLLF